MGRLRYTVIASLDGYTADADGGFDWAAPSPALHAWVNTAEREVGTYLYGRRMWETMRVWQRLDGPEDEVRDYGELWRAADKIVYSATLDPVTEPRARLERRFDPVAVRDLVAASPADVSLGGPTLAAAALRAGIVDDLAVAVVPVVVGGGTRWLPDGIRLDLELAEERRFADGAVALRYRRR